MTQHGMSGRSAERKPSPLFELARDDLPVLHGITSIFITGGNACRAENGAYPFVPLPLVPRLESFLSAGQEPMLVKSVPLGR